MLSKLNCKFYNTVTTCTDDTKVDVMWIKTPIVIQERAFPTQFDSPKIKLEGKKKIHRSSSEFMNYRGISQGLISYLLFYYLRDSVIEYAIFYLIAQNALIILTL